MLEHPDITRVNKTGYPYPTHHQQFNAAEQRIERPTWRSGIVKEVERK